MTIRIFVAMWVLLASCCAWGTPRAQITGAEQCAFLARDNPKQFRAEWGCAIALQRVSLKPWLVRCTNWSEPEGHLGTQVSLLAVYQVLQSKRRPAIFHPWAVGVFVLEIPCRDAAYNQSSLFFAYDERRFPARVNLLYFPQNQGRAKAEIGARAVDTARFSIMEYVKMRGMGDAGYYSRYVVNAITRRVHLVLQIRKDFPDGQDAFHWQGNLDAVPHGAGWVQVWPRPRHR